MNIAIVDDMQDETDALKDMLNEYAGVNHIYFALREFKCAEDFLRDYHPYAYTAIFMDIYMGGMNGMEAARKLREADKYAILIFLTSSGEHMGDAFQAHAYDYIMKPVEKKRLFTMLDDLMARHTSATDDPKLVFQSNRTDIALPYPDIKVVRTDARNYLEIIDKKGVSYKTRMAFHSVEKELLSDGRFLGVNRGVIVGMDYIVRFADGICFIEGNIQIPEKQKQTAELHQTFMNYKFNQIHTEHRERRRKK